MAVHAKITGISWNLEFKTNEKKRKEIPLNVT